MERSIVLHAAMLGIALSGCGDSNKPTMAEALKKADEKEAARKQAEQEEKEAIEVDKDSGKLEAPWTHDHLKASLTMGSVLVYEVTGTDAKGKEVQDTYRCEVKANNPSEVGVSQYFVSKKDEVTAEQVAKHDWSQYSPCFAVERPTPELTGKETVETPAGSFETVTADLSGFFGERRSVWMINDQPGVYAKVVDQPNANEEGDQTNLTYVLKEVVKGE